MKQKLIYGAISIILIAGAFMLSSFLMETKKKPQVNKSAENIMYVKTGNAEKTETISEMTNRGRITAFDNVSLAAEVSGKIMQGDIRFKTGESFKKGQVLINIYKEDVEASLKSGKSSFLQTLSVILPDIQVDYPEEFDKWNTFFQTVDPEKSLPPLPKIESNKEKVFLAANNVLSGYYSLQQQEINLSRYQIRAPFNGSFKQVNKEIGAISSPGAELATLIRSDKLEIVVPVFPKDLQWIEKGEIVQVIDHNGNSHQAKVARISSFVDASTQSANVYLNLNNNNGLDLLEGEFVDVVFSGVSVSGLEIPREALVDESFVYVLNDHQLIRTTVELIRKLNDSYIISGLDSSQEVVVESLTSIDPQVKYKSR